MSDPTTKQDQDPGPSLGRRNFIRQSVVSVGVTVHEYIKHSDATPVTKVPDPIPERTDWLRPPGAVEEREFLQRCTKCGDCLDACPYSAIQHHHHDETPILFAEDSPCLLCQDFPCISVCETEALLPVRDQSDVNMGLAVVSHRECTAANGCHACVSKCPTEALSMSFSNFQIGVDQRRCVGCGICQQVCKSVNDRVAIKVLPARMTA